MVLVTFGSVLISIIAFVFVLCTIVSLHELGHFFFAVKGGILCREYAIGMGPLLWKKKKGETQYSIRAFPIGGFCAIAGEVTEDDPLKDKEKVRLFIEDNIVKKICVDVDLDIFNDLPLYNLKEYDLYDANNTGHLYIKVANDEGEEITYDVANDASYVFPTLLYKKSNKPVEEKKKKCIDEIQIAPYNRQLNSKSIGRRAMVMFGGPLMNMILALVAFFFAYLISGVSNTSTTVLSEVSEGTPAYVAGLRGGYEITGMETTDLNGENYSNLNIDEWDDISLFLKGYKDNDASSSEIKVYYKNPDTGEIDNVTVKPMVIIYSISMMQDIESDDV